MIETIELRMSDLTRAANQREAEGAMWYVLGEAKRRGLMVERFRDHCCREEVIVISGHTGAINALRSEAPIQLPPSSSASSQGPGAGRGDLPAGL